MKTTNTLPNFDLIKESVTLINQYVIKLFGLLVKTNCEFYDELNDEDPDYNDDFIYDLPRINREDKYGFLQEYSVKKIHNGTVYCIGIYDNAGETRMFKLTELNLHEIISIGDHIANNKPDIGIEMIDYL